MNSEERQQRRQQRREALHKQREAEEKAAKAALDNFLSEIYFLELGFREEAKDFEEKLKGKTGPTSLADAGWEAIRIKYTNELDSIMEQNSAAKHEVDYCNAVEGLRNCILESEESLTDNFGSDSEKMAVREKRRLRNEKKLKEDAVDLKDRIKSYQKEINEFGWSPKSIYELDKCYGPFFGTIAAIFFFLLGLAFYFWHHITGIIFFIIGALIFVLALKSKIKKVNKERDKVALLLKKAEEELAVLEAKIAQGKKSKREHRSPEQ